MPNYFRLYLKGTSQPAILQDVDAEMCQHFDQPCDPVRWLAGWYNVIGCLIAVKGLALGSPELRQAVIAWYDGPLYGPDAASYRADMLQILEYLEARYTSDAWATVGKW